MKINYRQSLLFVSLNLFLFFNLNFLNATIKTESVVVNTNEIIDSTNDKLKSNKIFALHYNDEFLLTKAPKCSFFQKLYSKKVNQNQIYIIRQNSSGINEIIVNGAIKYLLFSNDLSLNNFLSLISRHVNFILFVKAKHYYETEFLYNEAKFRKEYENFNSKRCIKCIRKRFSF